MYTDIQCSATIYSKLYCIIFKVGIALLQVITMKADIVTLCLVLLSVM